MNQLHPHITTEYRAMLVRFSRDPDAADWRITVRDVDTAQQLAFATLPELVAYLMTITPQHKEHEA